MTTPKPDDIDIIELVEVTRYAWVIVALVAGIAIGAVVIAIFTETNTDA